MATSRKRGKASDITGNRLLDVLPNDDREALVAVASAISPPQGRGVYQQGGDISYVYFPISAMYSLVLNLDSGEKAEVATVGNEGFVGLPVFFQIAEKSLRGDASGSRGSSSSPSQELFPARRFKPSTRRVDL